METKIIKTVNRRILSDGVTIKEYPSTKKYTNHGYLRKDGTRQLKVVFTADQIADMESMIDMGIKKKIVAKKYDITYLRLSKALKDRK